MHYGIVWGERQRIFPQDFPLILWEYSLSFPPYNTIMQIISISISSIVKRFPHYHKLIKSEEKETARLVFFKLRYRRKKLTFALNKKTQISAHF